MTPADTMRAAVEALSLMYANSHGNTDDEISARLRARSALSLLRSALDEANYGNCSYWCPACYAAINEPKPEHKVALEQGEPHPMHSGYTSSFLESSDKGHRIIIHYATREQAGAAQEWLASIPPNTPVEAGELGVAAGAVEVPVAEWLLYEHDDGRHAVAPSAGVAALAFTAGEPGWHRVGPVAAHGVPGTLKENGNG